MIVMPNHATDILRPRLHKYENLGFLQTRVILFQNMH